MSQPFIDLNNIFKLQTINTLVFSLSKKIKIERIQHINQIDLR